MSKKKNLKHESFNNVKITDADIKKYAKKHTVISKGKAIGSVIAGVALLGASAGAATYFALTRKSGSGGQIVEQTYTVTFNDQFEGSPKITNVKTLKDGLVEEPKINFHDGYGFGGWFKDSQCTRPFDFNEKITSNITLYGKWYESSEDGLIFNPIEDSMGNITGYSVARSDDDEEAAKLPAHLVIPPTHGDENLPVLEIEKYGFANANVVTVSVPSTVTTIKDRAFIMCGFLTHFQTSNSIKTIKEYAFAQCGSLTNFSFDDSLEEIDNNAFYESSLSKIKLSSSIKSIGSHAFNGNYLIKEIDLSECNQLKSVPEYLAFNCSFLTKVKLSDTIEKIGEGAFKGCSSLKEINIPATVKTIGESAFESCGSLISINFPSNSRLINIGDNAFYMCLSLTEITIPKYVINIGEGTFYGCSNLKRAIFLNDFDTYYVSRYERNSGGLIVKDENYDIKNSTPEQNASLLFDKENHYGYSFVRNGKTDTESKLFYIISGDNEVTINGRSDLTTSELQIPLKINNMIVTAINEGAFNADAETEESDEVTPLEKITIEVDDNGVNENLKEIGSGTFKNQTNISEINNLDCCVNLNYVGDYAFYKVGNDVENFTDLDLDLTETVLANIGMNAFDSIKLLKSIKLPSTLTKIGNYAFKDTKSLTSADFTLCTNLSDFGYTQVSGGAIPAGRLGDGIFSKSSVTSLDLSNTKILELEACSFYGSSLATISLPNSLLTIGRQCFRYCNNLTEITIPSYVCDIDNAAFSDCGSLTSVTVDSLIIAGQDNPGYLYNILGGQNPKIVKIPHGMEVGDKLSDENEYTYTEGEDYDTYTQIM